MTALDYMKKQVEKATATYKREASRGAPPEILSNLQKKIGYYAAAVVALEKGE